jgi:thiamine pyrophosphokinase
MDALVFANGEAQDGPAVRAALALLSSPLVIAADGGAHNAAYFGYHPKVVIGDLDSLDSATAAQLEAEGTIVLRYSADKDETDLELALLYAAKQDIDRVIIIGGVGGRIDQLLANVYLLALPEMLEHDARLVADRQTIRLLRPGRHQLHGEVGDTLSLLPMGGPALGISTAGLRYPLRAETLRWGQVRGISNVFDAPDAQIQFNTGLLLCVHTLGRA